MSLRRSISPTLAGLLVVAGLTACRPGIERSGLVAEPDAAPAQLDARLGTVSVEPAIDQLTVGGLVVVEATFDVRADALARVVALPLAPGDAVEVGDVVAVLQPSTPELEALDAASRELAAATVAASGPLADRPSAETIRELVIARDAAAAALRATPAAAPEPIALLAESSGVVVSHITPLGGLVDADGPILTMGPTTAVEVHASVDNALVDLFVEAASNPALVERTEGATPQPLTLSANDPVVGQSESSTTLRLTFDNPPRVSEGQRVDVVVAIEPDPGARSIPVDALRIFNGQSFLLVVEDDDLRRVDVEVSRLGQDRVEVVGAVGLGDAVLLR